MRVVAQLVSLLVVLIVGIFIGIDQAESNMQKLQGTEGAPRAVQIMPTDHGRIEIAVFGQTVDAKNPVPTMDREKMEHVTTHVKKGTNLIAEWGNQIGEGIRLVTREAAELIFLWAK